MKPKRKSAPSAPLPEEHVVAVYEGQWFIAVVCNNQDGVAKGHTKLSYMKITGMNQFIWEKEDIWDTDNDDILMRNILPVPINSRGHFGLKKDDYKKIMKKMTNDMFEVVLYSFSSLSIIFLLLVLVVNSKIVIFLVNGFLLRTKSCKGKF